MPGDSDNDRIKIARAAAIAELIEITNRFRSDALVNAMSSKSDFELLLDAYHAEAEACIARFKKMLAGASTK